MESLGQQQGAANHTTITPAGGVDSRGLAVLVLCRATTQEKPACPQPHADNLARLIEMLAAAAEYAERSGGTLGEECLIDVEGAQHRTPSVLVRQAELGSNLDALVVRIDARRRELAA